MSETNWTQTTDEEQLFEFEHDEYDGLLLRGEDRRLGKKPGVAGHWAVTLLYRANTLDTIVGHADAREPAHERAVAWTDDHPGLAGYRINDGVDAHDLPRTHQEWTKDERKSAVEDLKEWGYDEGSWFFHGEKNDYYVVTELTADGFVAVPLHENSRRTYGVYSTNLATICYAAEQECHPVRDAVCERGDELLERYAEMQISRSINTHGADHPVNGFDGIETFADLRDALLLSRQTTDE